MGRKKTVSNSIDHENIEKADRELTGRLNQAFEHIVQQQFGSYIAPPPISTKFGIEPLDSAIGGGIYSSAPIRFSSTPETGKSTLAFQYCKSFLDTYQNGIAVYIDIEGAGNANEDDTQFRLNRIQTFGIEPDRFQYLPMILDLNGVFNIVQEFCEIKRQVEEEQKKEFYLCIVWDSIAATPSSKTADAETHDSIIGFKARQLTFLMDKYASLFAFNRVTFIIIDQVRANLKIDGPYVAKEKSVGSFKDYKAASSIASLDHRTSQWIFLSKKKEISPSEGLGIDGWYMVISTEKNKHAPSGIEIEAVFDKSTGLNKFWTEFHFLSEPIPTEKKIFQNKLSQMPYPLSIQRTGAYYYLEVIHPETGEVHYTSKKFHRKNAKELYENDEEFQQYFDAAVQISVQYRIIRGLFRFTENDLLDAKDSQDTAEIEENEYDEEIDMGPNDEKQSNEESEATMQPLMDEPNIPDNMQPLMDEPNIPDDMDPLTNQNDNQS